MRTEQPDELAAEARRWVCRSTMATDEEVIEAVITALGRYYEDLAVVEGIVGWRIREGVSS